MQNDQQTAMPEDGGSTATGAMMLSSSSSAATNDNNDPLPPVAAEKMTTTTTSALEDETKDETAMDSFSASNMTAVETTTMTSSVNVKTAQQQQHAAAVVVENGTTAVSNTTSLLKTEPDHSAPSNTTAASASAAAAAADEDEIMTKTEEDNKPVEEKTTEDVSASAEGEEAVSSSKIEEERQVADTVGTGTETVNENGMLFSPSGRPRRPRAAAAKAAVEAIKETPSASKSKMIKEDKTTPATLSPTTLLKQKEEKDNLNIGRLVEQNKFISTGTSETDGGIPSGQYYPHHGKILEKKPKDGRIPSRYVIRWDNPITKKTTASSEEETAVAEEVLVCKEDEWIEKELQDHDELIVDGRNPFKLYNSRRPEKSRYTQPLKVALENVRERYHKLIVRDIEHEETTTDDKASNNEEEDDDKKDEKEDDSGNKGGDLLSTLVLMAALEDALQTSLQYQQQQEQERQQKEGQEEQNIVSTTSRKKKNLNLQTHPPLYYNSNPNQYLTAPSHEADEEELKVLLEQSKNPKAVLTPAMLAQRIRSGCEWAWTYLQQQQQQQQQQQNQHNEGDEEERNVQQQPPKFLDEPTEDKISATSIELEIMNTKAGILFDKELKSPSDNNNNNNINNFGNGDFGNGDFERRISSRSAIKSELFDPTSYGDGGRRSTRTNVASYAESHSMVIPEPNPVQKGGRVALWWLKTLEEKQKQEQQVTEEEEEEEGEEVEVEEEEEEEGEEDGDAEMNDDGDVSTTITTTTTAKKKKEELEEEVVDEIIDETEDEEATKADDDEDFSMSKDGGSEDESLEDVVKERAGTLSPISEQEQQDDDDDDDEDEEEDEEEEEEEDEEHAIIWDNPYLQPSFPALLEYLSKPKSISGEDVQRAMDDITLRLRKNKRTTDHGIPIESLETYDRVVLDWENPDHPKTKGANVVLKCVSGESANELQRLDAGTFGRCKFELDIIGQKEKTVQIQRREDFNQREIEYKERKAQDKWRFRGIHEGYTIWPSWDDAATKWIQENVTTTAATATSVSGSSASAIESVAVVAATSAESTATTAVFGNNDEALARSLEESEDAAGTGGRRRTGRRSRGANAGNEGVFYGNQSQLTQKQLVDALFRLVKVNSFQTMMKLQSMVGDDSSDPLRRCRIALGKVIWKRNLVARQAVSSDGSDRMLLQELAAGKQLVQILPPPKDGAIAEEKEKQPHHSEEIPEDAKDLLQYLSHLHDTELKLRSLVLKQLEVIPLPIIATAADERLGSLENMDATDFEDPSTIDWKSTGNCLIQKRIYRPPVESTMGTETTSCYWYKIQDYSESIKSEAEDAEEGAMERRMRFRAVPTKGFGGQDVHKGDVLILTEGQVHAGMKTAEIQQKQSSNKSSSFSSSTTNPYATQIGKRITLVPLDDGEEVHDGSGGPAPITEISVRVVGHDNVVDPDDPSDIEYRILILPELNSNEKDPFWAVLDVRADTGLSVCQPEGQTMWYSIETQDFHKDSQPYKECEKILDWLSRQSKAQPFMWPVDPIALGIPTYPDIVKNPMDITTVTEKLENGTYSNIPPGQSIGSSLECRMLNGPFRKDIEQIFDNAILFNPPDDWIAVAATALKKSVIKKIENAAYMGEKSYKNSGGVNQRKSMYADEDSDVDMYVDESDNDDDFGSSSRSRNKRKRSTTTKKVTNKADEVAARPLEHPIRLHNCLKDGNDLRGRFSDLPVNSYASTYSMPSGWSCRTSTVIAAATGLATTTEAESDENDEDDENENSPTSQKQQEYMQEMAELLALQKEFGDVEASSIRRSSRAVQSSTGGRTRSGKKNDTSSKTEGLEYFLRNMITSATMNKENGGITNSGNEKALSAIPSSRLDVEVLQEKRHEEYYSMLYQRYEKELSGHVDGGFGIYTSSSFPSYLGRVISSKNSHGYIWEIRPPFVVPALRWVIRGLVHSGHLTATESLTGYSGESGRTGNIDVTAGMIVTNDIYYYDPEKVKPFEILDTRILQRKKRGDKSVDEDSDDDFEMSEYEKLRAERVARNAERLKALGLA